VSTERPVVIAGGGTGGHVIPGLAIARALVARGVPVAEVRFVGSARGLEAELVPAAGFDVTLLPGRGIQRRLTWENLGAAWGLVRAFWQAFTSMVRTRPRVVVCLGGYASVAAAASAVVLRVPIVVTEQNARAGAANRLFGRFAAACAVPFEETDLPHAVVTGNPVRDEVLARGTHRDRVAARRELDVEPGRRVVAAFAGSLGATSINRAVIGLIEAWGDRSDLHVHHVLGSRDWDRLERPSPPPDGIHYRAVRYEDRMDRVLAAADLAVSRAGGTTVAELAVVGVASVLVPFPLAPRDHQTANARSLVAAGGAVLIPDDELTTERLAAEVEELLHGDRLLDMSSAAHGLGHPDAADRVAALVLGHAD
jgi:undecaprenyldiphospho-muramoylpentapeptide beta-N-acetylglucosaminyltransferase